MERLAVGTITEGGFNSVPDAQIEGRIGVCGRRLIDVAQVAFGVSRCVPKNRYLLTVGRVLMPGDWYCGRVKCCWGGQLDMPSGGV